MASEDQVAENGEILIPFDEIAAGTAAGPGPDDRLSSRDAVDADIEKGSDNGTKNKSGTQKNPEVHKVDVQVWRIKEKTAEKLGSEKPKAMFFWAVIAGPGLALFGIERRSGQS